MQITLQMQYDNVNVTVTWIATIRVQLIPCGAWGQTYYLRTTYFLNFGQLQHFLTEKHASRT